MLALVHLSCHLTAACVESSVRIKIQEFRDFDKGLCTLCFFFKAGGTTRSERCYKTEAAQLAPTPSTFMKSLVMSVNNDYHILHGLLILVAM
jgi:hypothetical protein